MDMSLSLTTNKTLKLYAENQPKALLISKETLSMHVTGRIWSAEWALEHVCTELYIA